MAGHYLEIRNVTKRFDKFTALLNVSLDVEEGEFVCFLGPSGCGKTTLLRAIAGLDIQTEGTIHQAGKDISPLPPEERDFGIVFQSYALFPNLTVRRNIAFGLENRKMNRAEIDSRVTELLELVGLPDKGNSYPAQISGGQQQRVALARALAPKPGLILLDEPLSALDAKVRLHLRHELKTLQSQLGVTMIMVTHDQDEALSLADRIVVMNVGVVEQVGTPEDIYDRPATRFVADFIGAMNFIPGAMLRADAVSIGGIELACPANGHADGAKVTVAIRPEDVVIAGDGAALGGNSFDVNVGSVEFLGPFARAQLVNDAFKSSPLVAQVPYTTVRSMGIEAGRTLRISLPQERLRIFDREAAHG
ncbi:MAG: putative 2-aminoethylphosphonate ABC transporter ATP-binding protein [Rhodobacterales bacterium]|nr:putative 2-aminoethylphosphonate ABC transporter ATP-binding protein [Rhodobacterales bacterium]